MGREGRRDLTEMLLGDSTSPSGGPTASWSVISDSRVLAGLLWGGILHTSMRCRCIPNNNNNLYICSDLIVDFVCIISQT